VSQYQKGKTNLNFTEARNSEWQWNPLGHMQVCTLLQTDNHANTHRSVFTGRMPFLSPNQQRQGTDMLRYCYYYYSLFFITPYTAAHTNTIKIQKKLKYN